MVGKRACSISPRRYGVPLHHKTSLRQTETSSAGAGQRIGQDLQKHSQSALSSNPAWLSVSQLCRRWQLSRKTIYKFIDSGILPVWKVGSHLYRISVGDILRFERQNAMQPDEPRSTSEGSQHGEQSSTLPPVAEIARK
jgi:excisionase family DNA binding protein